MKALRKNRLLDQKILELRQLIEELLEHQEALESASSEQVCQLVVDWLWLRILGWCQRHRLPDEQREDLLKLLESARQGLPLNGINSPATRI